MAFAFNEKAVRRMYRLLKHDGFYSQLHCQDVENNRLVARDLVFGEQEVVRFAQKYNGQGNLFIGRNPRNKDGKVAVITSVSFDIDPTVYDKAKGSTSEQLESCIRAASRIMEAYPGGNLILSGNGILCLYAADKALDVDSSAFGNAFRDFTRTKIEPLISDIKEARLDPLHDSERLTKIPGTVSCRGTRRLARFSSLQDSTQGTGRLFSSISALLLQPSSVRGAEPRDFHGQERRFGGNSDSRSAEGLRDGSAERVLGLGQNAPSLVPHGQRHNYLVSVAGALRRKGLGEEAIYHGIRAAFQERCEQSPAPSEEAFRSIARSMMRYEPGEMRNGTLSRLAVELGNNDDNSSRIVLRSTTDSLEDYKLRIEKRAQYATPELPFGFPELDRATWGLRRGEVFTVAARTGVGKSSFCVNVALNIIRQGRKVLFLSTEMSYDQIFDRLVSAASGIAGDELQQGKLGTDSQLRFSQALEELKAFRFSVADAFEPSIAQVEAAIKESGADVVIFDHIQHAAQGADTKKALSDLVKGLKRAAMTHNVAVIAVSQVARPLRSFDHQTKATVSSKLNLFELKGSGDIENESAMVLLLHPSDNNLDEDTTVLDLELAKNRFGQTLYTSLAFDKKRTTFRPLTGGAA